MDTRAHNKYSDRVLVKMVGGTPLFSPTLPEKDSTWDEHSQTERRGQGTVATQSWKHLRGWMSSCPDTGAQRSPGNRKRKQKPQSPGADTRLREGSGLTLTTWGQRQEGDPRHALPHPNKDRSRGWGGVGEEALLPHWLTSAAVTLVKGGGASSCLCGISICHMRLSNS